MKNTNHTTHMVHHVQAMQAGELLPNDCLYPYHCVGEQTGSENSQESCFHGESSSSSQSLMHMTQSIRVLGSSAAEALEEQIELLQNQFMTYLTTLLHEKGIVLEEKITLSLSQHNTLVLECAAHEDALLAALGDNEALVNCLRTLRAAALTERGLQYLTAAQQENISDTMPQYKVCAKGALSHFYLKQE